MLSVITKGVDGATEAGRERVKGSCVLESAAVAETITGVLVLEGRREDRGKGDEVAR